MTFGELTNAYLSWLGPRPSATRYRALYARHFRHTPLHARPADQVSRHDVLLIKQQYESTPAQCSKAIGLIKQAYNWGLDRIDPQTHQPLYDGSNPAARVTKPSGLPRERLMDRTELRALLGSLHLLNHKYQAFLVCRLLVPCRIKELCEMRRDSVNLESGKWFKRTTKNGRAQYVLIATQALPFLRLLPPAGEFFFQGAYQRPIQRESVRKIWSLYRRTIGLADVQLLDFRRTLATYLYTELQADELTVKALLNHYDGRPVAVYTRLNYDRLAEITQRYADWIWSHRPQEDDHEQIDMGFDTRDDAREPAQRHPDLLLAR